MRKTTVGLFAIAVGVAGFAEISVVPMPKEIVRSDGVAADGARVVYVTEAKLPAEGYRLKIGRDRITIASSGAAGRFYAEQTLAQLKEDGRLECMEIVDAPSFSWRGVHVDDCRHFFGKTAVRHVIDTMAYFKMNRLHWHLTDDQGWRIEVPGYPELVKYGAAVAGRENEKCYYTEADLREIVKYAAERQILVVPEVEIPGHFHAALAAYPEFSCRPENHRDRKVCGVFGIADEVMCVGNPRAVKFAEDVLDFVCTVFPSEIVHIGGDECPRTRWRECPKCRALMAREGMASADEIQSWVTRHFVDYLAKKGRRALGWDEYLFGDVPASAIGMVWRTGSDQGTGGLDLLSPAGAAAKGHDLVMSPVSHCYLDYGQGIPGDQTVYLGGLIPLEKSYDFNPVDGIPEELRSHILGGQGNNWSEMTETEAQLMWKMWPRAAAIAESLWCGEKKGEYADFERRIRVRNGELRRRGIACGGIAPRASGEFHVSPAAAEGGDGSEEKPFNAFWPAQAAARRFHEVWPSRPATIYLHAGEYALNESLAFDVSDMALTVKAYGNDRVTITGAKRITGFESVAGRPGVFAADVVKCGYRGFESSLTYGKFESGVRSREVYRENGFYANGERLTLARWPNAGEAKIGAVDAAEGHVVRYAAEGLENPRLTRADSPDLRVSGYPVNLRDHEVVHAAPREDGSLALDFFHPKNAVEGNPFHLSDSLELLDAPGEWYLDRAAGRIYVMPPEGTDVATAEWVLAGAAFPLVRVENTHDVRFENIVFEYTRGDAIVFSAADDCGVSGSVVRHVGGRGIVIAGSRNVIEGCVLRDLGFDAVSITGGDRRTLAPGGNALRNSEISDTGRTLRCQTPGLFAYGCGTEVTGNHFHDIPSSAIRIGGNDHRVESNLFERVVTESGDQGAIDTCGDPTFGDIVFRHNVFRHLGAGGGGKAADGAGIRLGEAISCMRIEGNRFEDCSHGQFGSVQIHAGRFNVVTNNLMVGGCAGVSIADWDARDPGRWRFYVTGRCSDRGKVGRWGGADRNAAGCFTRVNVDSEIWRARYPWLQHAADTVCANTIVCNVMVETEDGVQIRNRTESTADIMNVSFKRMPSDAELAVVPWFTVPPTAEEVGPKSGAFRRARAMDEVE